MSYRQIYNAYINEERHGNIEYDIFLNHLKRKKVQFWADEQIKEYALGFCAGVISERKMARVKEVKAMERKG